MQDLNATVLLVEGSSPVIPPADAAGKIVLWHQSTSQSAAATLSPLQFSQAVAVAGGLAAIIFRESADGGGSAADDLPIARVMPALDPSSTVPTLLVAADHDHGGKLLMQCIAVAAGNSEQVQHRLLIQRSARLATSARH